MIRELTAKNFETEALSSELPVLIDFWASWCAPCKMVAPIVDEVAEELEGKVRVMKVNIDEQPELTAQYGIRSIPTLLVLKNGEVAATSVGMRGKQAILELLEDE